MTTFSAYRGDDFDEPFALDNGWLSTNFDEFWFTVRSAIPASSVLDDTDAAVLAQVRFTGASPGITFDVDNITGHVHIDKDVTRTWPATRLFWDLQGRLTTGKVKTLNSGEIRVKGDVTRSQ